VPPKPQDQPVVVQEDELPSARPSSHGERSMLAYPKIGDFVTNTCRRCNRVVRSQMELRAVRLTRTRLVVSDVPVDVCPECGHMISIAPHGVEQLREAGWHK
jgi:hypothetical protein